MTCSTYIKNRSAHRSIGMTPYERWYGKKPHLGHMRIFGCRCYAHLEKEHRKKFDSHTIECVFLGYYSTESLFAVYDVNKRVILKKRDGIFVEGVLRHPSMAAWGLAPGYDILGLPISDREEFETLESI